jgi:hypothetical protein
MLVPIAIKPTAVLILYPVLLPIKIQEFLPELPVVTPMEILLAPAPVCPALLPIFMEYVPEFVCPVPAPPIIIFDAAVNALGAIAPIVIVDAFELRAVFSPAFNPLNCNTVPFLVPTIVEFVPAPSVSAVLASAVVFTAIVILVAPCVIDMLVPAVNPLSVKLGADELAMILYVPPAELTVLEPKLSNIGIVVYNLNPLLYHICPACCA